ncbi:hypothetical protein HYH03_010842 [Edaphochlamys debaryana]|uniref:Uncharacterized protein n=1 Tax=Edaphochlamys debaryana TaxID=47281 RepID=A0A835XX78_9CHLO|nr:hypothetical protein HYH03_010842 [Edaphochlamys debaryana]|eukprot:KAG2490673.1 hypothetical protein HYH03_010842 [Edaphochlamys debaryana]
MAFLQRLASGIKDTLFGGGGESSRPGTASSPTPPIARNSRGLSKTSSNGRGNRPSTASLGWLESHIRDAIAQFVQDKFDKGQCKPHVFTQFWLQFPKLEAGFAVLRSQLEARTGCREGPLPLGLLAAHPEDFGLGGGGASGSGVVGELCAKAATQRACKDLDFVGLVMLLLVVHITEPQAMEGAAPEVHTMLSCLELAFTHFNSARKGKLDKREVGEALQYESAKAHAKEGRGGRTSNRLAHRLFEGLDWEYDNTISFENFLRGILQLVSDEFGDEDEDEDDPLGLGPAGASTGPESGTEEAAGPGQAHARGRRPSSGVGSGSASASGAASPAPPRNTPPAPQHQNSRGAAPVASEPPPPAASE